jgi:hypothetical protein
MYFSYLNLPSLPEEFVEPCIKNLEFIGIDPRLEQYNFYRQEMNRATYCPRYVIDWLIKNIKDKFPEVDGLNFAFLNITTYLNGYHPKHVDIGRSYALNYYINTGGTHTNITWFADDRETILHTEHDIQPNRWALLKVNPVIHEVDGIEPEKRRIFISMSINEGSIVDEDKFLKQIEHLLVK